MNTIIHCKDWNEAEEAINALSEELSIYWGKSGSPIARPHVVAYTMDNLSGDGRGYHLTVYPDGYLYGCRRWCYEVVIDPAEARSIPQEA